MKTNISQDISGILLVDKPQGWTSFDVIGKLRSITKVRKIGHAGTLDPLATGLLIVLIGKKYTRQQDSFMKKNKTYQVIAQFGQVSETYDLEGELENVASEEQLHSLSEKNIRSAIKKFTGKIEQQVPMYSAVKVDGEKLYNLARADVTLSTRPIRKVEIFMFKLNKFDQQKKQAVFEVECSSGTYIRTLIHDLGQELDVGSVVTKLRRTKIDGIDVSDAINVDQLDKETVIEHLKSSL